MYIIEIHTSDGKIEMPIEKALLIPKLREIIISKDNREFHLKNILRAEYDVNNLISILYNFKK
jgi:hypothetical protein